MRLRSYVHSERQEDYDTEPSESTEAQAIGDTGEDLVVLWEGKHDRPARRMPRNNPGYDIVSNGPGGPRYIEVKSIDGPWTAAGVALSRPQFESALEHGEQWWLYVVEGVYSTEPVIHMLPNPLLLATEFRIDDGWRGAEVRESIDAGLGRPVAGQKYRLESGQEATIEGDPEQWGALWIVQLRFEDGTERRRAWNPKWKAV